MHREDLEAERRQMGREEERVVGLRVTLGQAHGVLVDGRVCARHLAPATRLVHDIVVGEGGQAEPRVDLARQLVVDDDGEGALSLDRVALADVEQWAELHVGGRSRVAVDGVCGEDVGEGARNDVHAFRYADGQAFGVVVGHVLALGAAHAVVVLHDAHGTL